MNGTKAIRCIGQLVELLEKGPHVLTLSWWRHWHLGKATTTVQVEYAAKWTQERVNADTLEGVIAAAYKNWRQQKPELPDA